MRRLLTLAILVGMLLLVAELTEGMTQSDSVTPAPPSPVTGPDGCDVEPRPVGFFESIALTSVPFRQRERLIRAYRGAPIVHSQADLTAVTRTIDTAVFCQNLGDFARLSALFSEEYWLDKIAGMQPKGYEFTQSAAATPEPPAEQLEHRWSFGDARLLADGRIAGFLRWDQRNIEDAQLVAFRQVDGQWLFDEVVFANEPEILGTPIR